MAYKKPVLIVKSSAKQSFVAGCPYKGPLAYCTRLNVSCMTGALK